MRIISKFKDYYDFISYRYGADPNCTYIRAPLKLLSQEIEFKTDAFVVYFANARYFEASYYKFSKPVPLGYVKQYEVEFVVAGPWCQPVLIEYFEQGPEPDGRIPRLRKKLITKEHDYLWARNWRNRVNRPSLPDVDELNKLIKIAGAPVFTVKKQKFYGKLFIDEKIPILKDLGFASIVAPEQMWQGIYTMLTTVLRKNPDKAPPVEVDNEHRIYAAGFDIKTSFRHPVNLKKLR